MSKTNTATYGPYGMNPHGLKHGVTVNTDCTCLSVSCPCLLLVFGMVLMATILFTYYGPFYPTTQSAALEHTGKVHENQVSKRDLSHETNDVDDDNYYDEPDEPMIEKGTKEIIRRAISSIEGLKSAGPAGPSTSDPSQPTDLAEPPKVQNVSASPKGKLMRPVVITPTTSTTPDPNGYDPDVQHSNTFLDAVFASADSANMTQSLGLCRKNTDFKVADYKAPLFPADSASDVLQCINDLLKSQTKHHLCVHLDPEMNAYLKWLILTGESKEKHRPVKIGLTDDFLFPSTPCASDSPHQTPECLVARGLPEDIHF